jgi:hypothetical protein
MLLLEYDGSSIVKTLNLTSSHMWQMVKFETEISPSVGGFSLNISDQ